MKTKEPHLIPAEKAAPRLGRHPITLRRDLRDGRIPGIKIGGRWFMSSSVLDQLTGDPAGTEPPARD